MLKFLFFDRDSIIIYGHLSLAIKLSWINYFSRKQIICLHGIEAWFRPSIFKRLILSKQVTYASVSQYTLEKAIQNLHGRKHKILHNYVPLNKNHESEKYPNFSVVTMLRLEHGPKLNTLRRLADAINHLEECQLIIIGKGPLYSKIKKEFQDQYPNTSIKMLGYLEDPSYELSRNHVFCMANSTDGFGRVFVEAMQQGLPCIGHKLSGASEVIKPGVNGQLVTNEIELLRALKTYKKQYLNSLVNHKAIRDSASSFSSSEIFLSQINSVLKSL